MTPTTHSRRSISQRRRSVQANGALFARFVAKDGTIELDGMHHGFDIQVRYFRNDLYRKFALLSAEEAGQMKVSDLCCIDP